MKWRRVRQETSPDKKTATQSSVAGHRSKNSASPRIDQPGSPNGRLTLTAPTIRKTRAKRTQVSTVRSRKSARGDVKSGFRTRCENAAERFSRLPASPVVLDFLQTLSQASNHDFLARKLKSAGKFAAGLLSVDWQALANEWTRQSLYVADGVSCSREFRLTSDLAADVRPPPCHSPAYSNQK